MDDTLVLILTRALERLTVAAAGILAIWIGYRLFALMPERREGESKIALPGGVSIFISRVGPGIFFALFGTGLMAYSATKPVSFSVGSVASSTQGPNTHYIGISDEPQVQINKTEGIGVPSASPDRRAIIRYLNGWLNELPAELDGGKKNDRRIAVREAKLALLREIWSTPNWGDYQMFHKWVVETGQSGALPAVTRSAADIFNEGTKQ